MIKMLNRLRYIIVLALLLFGVKETFAQMAMPDHVCIGTTKKYSVNDPSVPSTYTWKIDGVTQPTTTNEITVTWNTAGQFLITVQERSADGCEGEIQSGIVYVYPVVTGTETATVCANQLPYSWNGNTYNAAGTYNVTLISAAGCDSIVTLTLNVIPVVTGAESATVCANQLPYLWNGNIYNSAGTYNVTLTSAAGCDSIITLTLNVNPVVTGTETATVCANQLPYTWNGNTYNSAGTYNVTLTSTAGCDSIVTLTLNVNPVVTGIETVTVCANQLPYTWNSNIYNAAGTYDVTLTSTAGCDSIVTLTLNVNPAVTGTETVTVCANQLPYTWNGNTYNAAGTYNVTLTNAAGCDSIVTLTLNVNPAVTGTETVTVCANQLPYTWNGNTYNAAGTYNVTLTNAAGCDSIVTLTLNVNPVVNETETATVCANQLPYTWNGNTYNSAGTYNVTLTSAAGCDSIVTLALNVNPVVTGIETVTICANQLPYTWNGNTYNTAGTYYITLISAAGCDSIVTLTLNVNPAVTSTQIETICTNQLPYIWNGNTYNAAGSYNVTLTSTAGCDSIVTLTLNVNPVATGTETATICANQLPYTWNGNTYNAAGTYNVTLISAAGCDSIVTLTLNVNPVVTEIETATVCANQLPYTWNGNTYNSAGTYNVTLTSAAGCDSIVTLTLTVNSNVAGSQTVSICANQLPYTWNGNTYNAAGTYNITLTSTAGCDSIVTLTLNVNPVVTGTETVTLCANQLPYIWNNNTYNAAGSYNATLISAAGCDSIVTLTLNVIPMVTGEETVTICTNQLPYTWNGNTYNTAGTYNATLISAAGCDSIVTLTLNVNPALTGTETVTVCANQLPYTWNGDIYNTAGTYNVTLTSSAGCDSVVTLTLNVNPMVTGEEFVTICDNQLPYSWNGNIYNARGTYNVTLISAAGCDSIVTITLNVSPAVTGTETVIVCPNQLPYTWNGNTYNAAGSYNVTLTSTAGCDSIVTLTLNVNPVVTGTETVTICANQLPYTWHGNTYNTAGTYYVTLLSATGCDSMVTLTLNVNPVVIGTETATVCANQLPYTWNGNTYNSAGTYNVTLTSAAGCDSIVTLTLNVNPAVTATETATICAKQLPYAWNGNTYNAAGTYNVTLTSAAGCDSIVTLTLNVNPAVTVTETVTVCANQLPYTWNGDTYNAAGSYNVTLTSAVGCDSMVTLNLNINPVGTGTETVTICPNQLPYTWNGNNYNAAGTYNITLISAAGCDSIVTLTLNVNPMVTGEESVTICANQLPYTWNGNTYTAAGTYEDTLISAAGCDSIVTLTLNVNPMVTGEESVTICANQLPYTWNGNTYTAAGTYEDTLISAAGCDSIVTLTLNVNSMVTGKETVNVCTNQLPYTWNGNTYTAAGNYEDTLINAAGCDSIVTLTLNVIPVVTGTESATICANQLPYIWNGNTYNAAGSYNVILTSAAGCDSIVTLTLNVNPVLTGTETVTVCPNQLPYTWHGNTYNTAGTYNVTLISAAGCDSIVTLNLNINPVGTGIETVTVCPNQLPHIWNGNTYNAAGIYHATLISAAGCDSIVTLTLNVNPIVTGTETATVCVNQLPYTWKSNIYNAAGTYDVTLTSAAGCDSIVTLTLNVNPVVTGTETATVCANQLPYTWNGNTYNTAGTYNVTLISAAGCDSIVTLTLNVIPVVTGTESATVCANQLPYTWNGNTYNAAGTYNVALTSAAGCDSIVTLTLNVNPVVTGTETATVCANQLPYSWNGNTYNAAGTYNVTLISAAGCDSIVTLTLNVIPVVTGAESATVCANQLPYIWNGNTYNAAGTYNATLISAAGCDSIVTLTLNVNPALTGTETVTVCANQLPYTWNGNIYTEAGTYEVTLISTAGCDSIVTLTLNINPSVTGTETVTLCANQLPYTWNGNTYNAAGTYNVTLISAAGCDSIVTLNLNVNPAVTGTETVTVCTNQLPYIWNNNTYNTAGTYNVTLTSATGCDSIVTLTLNINPAVTGAETTTVCANQLPYIWNGNTYNAAGTYDVTLTNAAGCDSIVTLTLNINPAVTGTEMATVCANQLPYTWNGNTYNAAGSYNVTLTNAAGCDSIVTLTLNVNPAVTATETATICANQLPYTWNGNTYNTAGTYNIILISVAGCDSIVTLTLTVRPNVTGSQTISICANQLPYTWNGNTYTAAGTYEDTFTSAAGCDSIVTLTLNVNPMVTGEESVTICDNQLPYTWNGNIYTAAGTYEDTLISAAGCDSIVTLTLNINSVVFGSEAVTICTNQLPYNWNGISINTAGTYSDTLTSAAGCDSISNLILTVNDVLRDTTIATICIDQLPYTWNDVNINAAGTYSDTLTSTTGCDSIISLILTVNDVLRETTIATICTNQLPYTWNDTNITAAGTYSDTLTSTAGCDSIINLILTVNDVLRDTTTATICTNQLPYIWNGINITAAGTYSDTLTAAGCDSIVTLTLNVNPMVTGEESVTICANQLPYTWNGNTYNTAGTHNATLISAAGCDSTVTLTLNVNPVVTGTETITLCANQLPYTWNGNTYNIAGTYNVTLTSAAGCDSIVTLNLNVNPALAGTETATVCTNQLPYTWNGNIYNAAGTYNVTLTSAAGCDSIVTLNLNVNSVVTRSEMVTVCANQLPYTWNSNTYNAAGTYNVTLTTAAGCDSTITLTLNVNHVVTGTETVTLCTNQLPYIWNGNSYNAAGSYNVTLTNTAGCDSIVTLTLNVNSAVTGTETVTVCPNQLPYTWNGNTYNAAGTYNVILTSASGCDSIVTLALNVNLGVTGTETATICANQLPYIWNGNTYNAAGSYNAILTSAAGCDSIVTLTLNVNPVLTGTETVTVCPNQLPYTWHGNTYNTAGTYNVTLISAAGCDSIVTLTLNVIPVVTGTESATVCANQLPYTWNGNTYNSAGTYNVTLINAAGCDSIVILTLNVNPMVTGEETVNICINQLPYTWNGNIYTKAGTYDITLISAAECDSIVTLTLNVNPIVTGEETVTICPNQLPYTWNGNTYTAAGTYEDTLISAAGCDSIVTLTLNVNSMVTGKETVNICTNQLPYTWNGSTYTAAGNYEDTLINAAGCDSIVTLTLNVIPVVTGTESATVCANQLPYTWNGNTYNSAGTYNVTLTGAAGCDSIVTLTLNVNPVVTGTETVTVCANQLPYTWNGNTYNAAGIYNATLKNSAGCDSVVTLTLNVNPAVTGTETVTVCPNQLPHIWNGNTYNAAGIYHATLISAAGCDSIVTLTLNVNPIVTGTETATVCVNQLPYTWKSNIYNAAGTYDVTLTSVAGCDSIVTLTLNVNPVVTGTETATVCANQLPYARNGNIYTAAGNYEDTLISVAGCDSIVTFTLTVNPNVIGSQTVNICANQLPYTWNENTYAAAGTYKDTLISAAGCDSIVTLTLNVNTAVTGTQTATVCANQLPYTWNGNIYTAPGTYEDTLISTAGCDSIVTLTLNINPVVFGSEAVTICTNQLPYNWNGISINTAGTYSDTLTSAAGCDSITNLILTINDVLRDTAIATICTNQLPYTWNGININGAGTYSDTLTSAAGCDSINSLTLTVNDVLRDTTTATICTNQLPYTWNNVNINAPGTYSDTLTSIAGCDSITNLILTINDVLRDTTTATICTNLLPYTWNGNTYNTAGSYNVTLISAAGCDSIVTLILNVNSMVIGEESVTICPNQLPYTWNGNTYSAAGTYNDTLTNAAGCDSIVTLTLNINPAVSGLEAVTICTNQLPYNWNGISINTAGTYSDTLISAAGCDSIINLILTINDVLRDTTIATICTNQLPYTWNGTTITTAGTYSDTLISAAGCDSIANLILTINDVLRDTAIATICTNQLPYTWNGININGAGTYSDTLTSAAGCDSITNLILTVNDVLRDTTIATICTNQLPYTWKGITINTAGTYSDTLTNAAGCDSTVTLTLNVNPMVTGEESVTICPNQLPYSWNGNTYTEAGIYKDTLISTAGCDSIVTLTLNVNPMVTGEESVTICTNQLPYTWNGNSYNAAGTYSDTLTSAAGCVSIINLILNVNDVLRDTTTATVCVNQLPYTWNGININVSGTYSDTLTNTAGCDSITNLILTVNDILRDTTIATICINQLPYNWNGITINTAGTYSDTLTSTAGCDSITNLILTVNDVLRDTTIATICTNQLPYTWNGTNINTAGTYSDTLTSTAGCDSITNLILTINDVLRDTATATICTNQLPYTWNSITITTAGTYSDTLTSTAGCDSIINLILTVNNILRDTTIATICTNQLPYTWNGTTITTAGTYSDTLTSTTGCDSISNLILTVNDVLRDTTIATICTNQLPYIWNGNTITAAGTYSDTLTSTAGCDSISNLILTINDVLRDTATATICTNQLPYTWNSITINTAGTYSDNLTSTAGCDSIANLILTINDVLRDTAIATICTNQLPYTWNGININGAGTYSDTLTSAAGCDSINSLTLTVNDVLRDTTTATICTNQLPYTWNNVNINTPGTYSDTLTSIAGCDSITNLILTINDVLRDTTTATICTNQLPYTWNGITINTAGTYSDTLTSAAGCDSITNLILTVNEVLSDTTTAIICNNQLPYIWNGTTITAAGTYSDTLTSAAGCDSIINLILNVNDVLRDTTTATVCVNQLPYTWNGINITTAGTYSDTLTSIAGCDSIINLILTINDVLRDTATATICTNQLPYTWKGININTAGTYSDTLTSAAGCDSIVTLTLNVNPMVTGEEFVTICTNQLPYNWNGITITTAGTYSDTLTSATGCDSITNLILTINDVLRDTTIVTICTNQLPYIWNGSNINTAGTYSDTLTSTAGCDSITNLILTINDVLKDTTIATICTNQLPYTWNGTNITAAGTYSDTLTSTAGCDSIVTLILNVNPMITGEEIVTICTNQLPYFWNGNIYAVAGTYQDTLVSTAGCDSITILTLNVAPTIAGAETVTICANQLPYVWNGNTYNTAGSYNDTLINTAGCDSIVTLTLIIKPNVTGSQTVNICTNQLPYTWNGNTYTAAGTYDNTLISAAGCDSIVTLTLNIIPAVTGSEAVTICTNQLPYNWNGISINSAGTYSDTLTSTAGCDSIINLILTINDVLRDTTIATICTNQLPYTWNGTTITTAGTYSDTLISAAGCDSIINLILTVNDVLRDTTIATICTNQLPYIWNGSNINTAGTYSDTLTSTAGCDSITNLILTINDVLKDTTIATICTNQLPYTWNGTTITTAGTYSDTLTSTAGCDSISNLILTVNDVLRDTTIATICTNQLPYNWNGITITTAGTYNDTLTSTAGCDSITNLILTLNDVLKDTATATICTNQLPYTWNGITINTAGTYSDTLISAAGCDSIINLILTINDVLRDTTIATICTNQLPYTWNGTTITTAGTYSDALISAAGCDSIINLILTVNDVLRDTTIATICTNQLPYNWNGININAAGTYSDTLTSAAGCDSITNLILTVNDVLRDTTIATICTNQLPYNWNGTTITAAGTYSDTLTNAAGCDSISNLILNVNNVLRDTASVTICTNQLPYTWNNVNINTAGTYSDTLTSTAGCDSISNLILTVNDVLRDTTIATICTNQLPYIWNGNTITAAGTYSDTLTSTAGCDSISNLILTVNDVLRDTTIATICTNQLPYIWNGNTITAAGTYSDTLTSTAGCDSITNLFLTVNDVLKDTATATICTNQLPYTWNGINISAAGTYSDTLSNAAGCDSIVTLILIANPIRSSSQTITICTNQLPYSWNGNTYIAAGTYKDTLSSITGCDSVVTLILNVNASFTKTENISTCEPSYQLPNGIIVTASGVYRSNFTNQAGCDSTIITNLTFASSPNLIVNNPGVECKSIVDLTAEAIIAGSDPGLNFSYWTDPAATQPVPAPNAVNNNGIYYIKAINAAGCQSIKSVSVQINQAPTATIAANPVCPGVKGKVKFTLSGQAPYNITYTDGTNSYTINNITSSLYEIEVLPTTNTTYTITSVSDAACTNTAVNASATVNIVLPPPSIRYKEVVTGVNQPTLIKARDLGSNYAYKWTPSTGLSKSDVMTPVFNYSQRMDYLIYITSDSGCIVIDTQTVKVIARTQINEPPNLWVPTAWSPHNKDGHNDLLYPFTVNIVELRYFRVFNRWGELVFETKEIGKGWDGIYKGVPQVMDTYTWTVEAVGNDGTVFKKAGNAMLLR